MEELQVRILIEHVDEGVIAYLYNRESFGLLKIEKQSYDKSQFIEIGQILEIEGRQLKVQNINFKMEENFHEMNPGYGVNALSPTIDNQQQNLTLVRMLINS